MGGWPRQGVLILGSCAIRLCEPCQGLTAAALNSSSGVPQGRSKGATYRVTASVNTVGESRTVPQGRANARPLFYKENKMTDNEIKIAVLIDAENASHRYLKVLLDELAKYGTATYKRIYADWTDPKNSGWKNLLLEHSIQPIQQYSYTTGKNASDSAMIIDAMDILYAGKVNAFCLVSSDSDFTKLAQRLREAGMLVIGMGEQKTPSAFIKSCERFIYLEVLKNQNTDSAQTIGTAKDQPAQDLKELSITIEAILKEISGDDGWTYLSLLGHNLQKRDPAFDTRTYGHAKLKDLVLAISNIEEKTVTTEKGAVSYVRVKPEKHPAPQTTKSTTTKKSSKNSKGKTNSKNGKGKSSAKKK